MLFASLRQIKHLFTNSCHKDDANLSLMRNLNCLRVIFGHLNKLFVLPLRVICEFKFHTFLFPSEAGMNPNGFCFWRGPVNVSYAPLKGLSKNITSTSRNSRKFSSNSTYGLMKLPYIISLRQNMREKSQVSAQFSSETWSNISHFFRWIILNHFLWDVNGAHA